MSDKVTAAQLAKLPKWAKEHINRIQRQRDTAVRALDEYTDEQQASPFYTEDVECTGEQRGPTFRKRYIQGRRMVCEYGVLQLCIMPRERGSRRELDLQWSSVVPGESDVALIPHSYNTVSLVAKGDMR